jgi:hypothetical protein
MLLILAATTAIALWAFVHYNPGGVRPGYLLACNLAVAAVSLAAGLGVGAWLLNAAAEMPGKEKFAWYLGIMAGGLVFNVVMASGGFLRNMVVFPMSRRDPAHQQAPRF